MRRLIAGLATTALVSGGLGLAPFGPASGTAAADPGGAHHWCPGDNDPTAPTRANDWDWNICHTYYEVKMGRGNVPYNGSLKMSNIWDGDNPPADAVLQPAPCPPSILPCL
jgi:hypothetical protein